MSTTTPDRPFDAYRGSEPYLFVSYAHRDSYRVYPEIERLHGLGFRLWYDEGIPAASEWPEEIARALDGAAAVLLFLSPAAAQSQNVRNEVRFAYRAGKPAVVVQLDYTAMPAELRDEMLGHEPIPQWRLPTEDFRARLSQLLPATVRSAGGADLEEHRRARLAYLAAVRPSRSLTSDEWFEVADGLRALGDEPQADRAAAAGRQAAAQEVARRGGQVGEGGSQYCPSCKRPVDPPGRTSCQWCGALLTVAETDPSPRKPEAARPGAVAGGEELARRLLPYEGEMPFAMVTYAAEDADRVVPQLALLQEAGYRLWFDAGRDGATASPEKIAQTIGRCQMLLAFLSEPAVSSQRVRSYLNFALDAGKDCAVVYLDEVALPPSLQLQIGGALAVRSEGADEVQLQAKIVYALPRRLKGMARPATVVEADRSGQRQCPRCGTWHGRLDSKLCAACSIKPAGTDTPRPPAKLHFAQFDDPVVVAAGCVILAVLVLWGVAALVFHIAALERPGLYPWAK